MKCSWITHLTCILGKFLFIFLFIFFKISKKLSFIIRPSFDIQSLLLANLCWQVSANLLCYLSVSIAGHFKMTGVESTHDAAWADIREMLKLDDPLPFHKSVYLGYEQRDTKIDPAHIFRKSEEPQPSQFQPRMTQKLGIFTS